MKAKHIVLALATALLLPALILALSNGGSVAEPTEQATSWSKGTLDSTNNARLSLSEQLDPEVCSCQLLFRKQQPHVHKQRRRSLDKQDC